MHTSQKEGMWKWIGHTKDSNGAVEKYDLQWNPLGRPREGR